MKALVLEEIGKLSMKEYPSPLLKHGCVLLKVLVCGICSSDIPRIFKTGTYHFPTVPGHEFAGEIVDVAEDIDPGYIGRKAAVFPLLPCGNCKACKNRQYALCDNYNYFGSRCDGGFEEYLVVPLWNLVFCPEKVPITTAALCEPVAVAKHCVDAGDVKKDKSVAIIGTGTIGLAAAIWAKIAGAKKVILIGRNQKKLDKGKEIGVDCTLNSTEADYLEKLWNLTDGCGPDVVYECVGTTDAIETAIISVKKGGKIVLTGNPEGDIFLQKNVYWKILRNEINICGTWNSSFKGEKDDWSIAMNYLSDSSYSFDKLITHTYPLDLYDQAFDLLRDKQRVAIKVMLVIGEDK